MAAAAAATPPPCYHVERDKDSYGHQHQAASSQQHEKGSNEGLYILVWVLGKVLNKFYYYYLLTVFYKVFRHYILQHDKNDTIKWLKWQFISSFEPIYARMGPWLGCQPASDHMKGAEEGAG